MSTPSASSAVGGTRYHNALQHCREGRAEPDDRSGAVTLRLDNNGSPAGPPGGDADVMMDSYSDRFAMVPVNRPACGRARSRWHYSLLVRSCCNLRRPVTSRWLLLPTTPTLLHPGRKLLSQARRRRAAGCVPDPPSWGGERLSPIGHGRRARSGAARGPTAPAARMAGVPAAAAASPLVSVTGLRRMRQQSEERRGRVVSQL